MGRYKGRTCVRAGREGELTKQEMAKIKKGLDPIDLELKAGGRFSYKKASEGSYAVLGDKMAFSVETFGGQSLKQMQDKAEEMQRTFGLAFLFDPFELWIEGENLVSPASNSPIYVEFSRK
jgi:hypothetical protein